MSMQTLADSHSFQITATDTGVPHQFAAQGARLVQIQADPGNAGTVTILGVTRGIGGNADTPDPAGPVLAAGVFLPPQWVADMSQLAYQFSASGDKINVLVGRA